MISRMSWLAKLKLQLHQRGQVPKEAVQQKCTICLKEGEEIGLMRKCELFKSLYQTVTDKASMLDEAIEYLKTLQLQVQMMSMGSGLFVPPVMLAGGMQHMGLAQMAHFSQISLGMGMGMTLGYGMGMLDMNGSPNYTSLPLPFPPMHSPQFNCSATSVPVVLGLHGVPATMAPIFRNPGDLLALAANPITNLPPPISSSGAETILAHALEYKRSSRPSTQHCQSAKPESVML